MPLKWPAEEGQAISTFGAPLAEKSTSPIEINLARAVTIRLPEHLSVVRP
jgi:hypothetical protein